MTFDLIDHQEGDQQAQQCGDSKSKADAHGDPEDEVQPHKDEITAGLSIDLLWPSGSLG